MPLLPLYQHTGEKPLGIKKKIYAIMFHCLFLYFLIIGFSRYIEKPIIKDLRNIINVNRSTTTAIRT